MMPMNQAGCPYDWLLCTSLSHFVHGRTLFCCPSLAHTPLHNQACGIGICACLTTVRSFINEIAGLRSKFGAATGYVYIAATVITGQLIACLIDGLWD
jgi:fluoride ion exporter CrcB/FEX